MSDQQEACPPRARGILGWVSGERGDRPGLATDPQLGQAGGWESRSLSGPPSPFVRRQGRI